MTYRELLEKLKQLKPESLDWDVSIYDEYNQEEIYGDFHLEAPELDNNVLKRPIIVLDKRK